MAKLLIMGTNIFVRYPKKGDVAVKVIATGEVKYIDGESFDLSKVDTTLYEVASVVVGILDGKVLVTRGNIGSYKWCDRPWWYLTGFTLDGTERTGVISIRVSTDSWAANVDKTITYNASDIDTFIEQLNEAFEDDTDFAAQDWYTDKIEGDATKVRVHCTGTDYRQYGYNTGKTGFSLGTCMPEITYSSDMLRKHGGYSGEGTISNMARALAYFRSDVTSTSYNPASDVTSVKRNYPVCLPAYLGTSQHQSDHCALLRSVYGEGEEGWLKFMNSCQPVIPSDMGMMTFDKGKERTALLGSFTYTSRAQTTAKIMCPAADAAKKVHTTNIAEGEYWLPTTEELAMVLDGVKHGTDTSRDADVLNKTLNKAGFPAVSNGSHLWSCCRYYTNNAWLANGNVGFFNSSIMYSSYGVVPVSLYPLR